MTVSRTKAQRMRKDDLVDALMRLQEGGEKPPFWEIKNLTGEKRFFPTDDPSRDVELLPHATALIPEYLRRSPGLLRAVAQKLIGEPYQVEEPTALPQPPVVPEDLKLANNALRATAEQILACNEVGFAWANWGHDIKSPIDPGDANYLRRVIRPVLRYVEYVDSQTHELTDEMRALVKKRLAYIATL